MSRHVQSAYIAAGSRAVFSYDLPPGTARVRLYLTSSALSLPFPAHDGLVVSSLMSGTLQLLAPGLDGLPLSVLVDEYAPPVALAGSPTLRVTVENHNRTGRDVEIEAVPC